MVYDYKSINCMSGAKQNLLELQNHCSELSKVLLHLGQIEGELCCPNDENVEFSHAAEWLELAAGINNVEILTARFDDCLMYCGTALEYEDARSELVSRIVTQLTIFQFAWGAFETTAKILNPPSIPSNFRPHGANGIVDRTIYFIKNTAPIPTYIETLNDVKEFFPPQAQFPGLTSTTLLPHMGLSGVGINFVRKVRNKFAHGATRFPMPANTPNGWCGKKPRSPEVIAHSTRITLFTIQMLLDTHYQHKHFDLEVFRDEDGLPGDADIHIVLNQLHLESRITAEG